MDEMSIKQATTYQKQSDSVHGLVDLGGAEAEYGLEDELANHLLCFVFVGLSSHYRYLSTCLSLVSSCNWGSLRAHTKIILQVTSRLLLHQRSDRRAAPATCDEGYGVCGGSWISSCAACRRQSCLQLQVFFKPFRWLNTACRDVSGTARTQQFFDVVV